MPASRPSSLPRLLHLRLSSRHWTWRGLVLCLLIAATLTYHLSHSFISIIHYQSSIHLVFMPTTIVRNGYTFIRKEVHINPKNSWTFNFNLLPISFSLSMEWTKCYYLYSACHSLKKSFELCFDQMCLIIYWQFLQDQCWIKI